MKSRGSVVAAALSLLALQPGLARAEGSALLLTEALNSAEGRAELDAATAGAPERFNKVTLYHLGKNSTPLRHELFRTAKNFVFVSTPYWYHDTEGTSLLDELDAAKTANRGLDVRY